MNFLKILTFWHLLNRLLPTGGTTVAGCQFQYGCLQGKMNQFLRAIITTTTGKALNFTMLNATEKSHQQSSQAIGLCLCEKRRGVCICMHGDSLG